MSWLHRRKDAELEEEIRFHLDRETEERMGRGLSRDQAEAAARRDFGNVGQVQEVTRAMWGWTTLERILQDVRYASRALARTPAFTVTAVLSLALGIAANVTSFSVADAFLLRPLPVSRPSEVVAITSQSSQEAFENVSYPVFRDIRDGVHSLSGVVAHQLGRFAFAASPGAVPQMRFGMKVSEGFFQTLGVQPALGRGFSEDESKPGSPATVVVLGHDFWQQQFAGASDVLGSTIRINGTPFTIVGVAPQQFTGMDPFIRPAFFISLAAAERLNRAKTSTFENRAERGLNIRARLRSGATVEQVQAELSSLARGLAQKYPDVERDRELRVRTELDQRVRQSPPLALTMTFLLVLSAAVLAIACANVAGLLLARSRARSREVAIRLAIGAGRARIVQQLLTESSLIAFAGGLSGILAAYGLVRYLSAIRLPTDTPIVIAPSIDLRVLAFALAISAVSALLFGLVPALKTADPSVFPALRSGELPIDGRRRTWGRSALVTGQVAVSLVLLVASGALLDAFRKMLILDPGIRTERMMMLEFDPGLIGYSQAQTNVFYEQLTNRVRALPGVEAASLTRSVPFRPNFTETQVIPEGYEFPRNQTSVTVSTNPVDAAYFDTVGTQVVRGRAFDRSDAAASQPVGIVNEEFARRYWPGSDAIGKRFRMNGTLVQVVGVAKTTKYLSLTETPTPYIYLPLSQHPQSRMTLLVRTEASPISIVEPVLGVVHALDANQPVFNIRAFSEYYEQGVLGLALITVQAVGSIGIAGLALALVGLYGLVVYSVSRRTREIGIRMAIGAQRSTVIRLVLRQGLSLTGAGVAAGLVVSIPVFRGLRAAMAGVGGTSAWTLVLVPLLLVIVAVCACSVPAWRATRIDPLTALRQD